MSEFETVHIVAMAGWLILASSALASYRLNWSSAVRMGLIWVAIFLGVYLLFDIVGGGG